MASTGTNYTGKWELLDGVLILKPVSGSIGIFRREIVSASNGLHTYIDLTEEEWRSVREIIFSSTIKFQRKRSSVYENESNFLQFFLCEIDWHFIRPPITRIDVTGLDTTGATNMQSMFSIDTLTEIVGIENLNVVNVTDFTSMFRYSALNLLDISSFPASVLNNADDVSYMFSSMPYCHTIVLPEGFDRQYAKAQSWDGNPLYDIGIAESFGGQIVYATKDGVTVANDKDFFCLTVTSQGGTWSRDISGSTTLLFSVDRVVRNGNQATIKYTYYSSTATVEVYMKTTSTSSFPTTPDNTFNITGTGTDNFTINLLSDSAYDLMVKVKDVNMTLYLYPSIDSNKLLVRIEDDGNVCIALDTSATSGVDKDLYDALVALGWESTVIV